MKKKLKGEESSQERESSTDNQTSQSIQIDDLTSKQSLIQNKKKEMKQEDKKFGQLKDQLGIFRRLDLDKDTYLNLNPQAREDLVLKTIAAGVIPG